MSLRYIDPDDKAYGETKSTRRDPDDKLRSSLREEVDRSRDEKAAQRLGVKPQGLCLAVKGHPVPILLWPCNICGASVQKIHTYGSPTGKGPGYYVICCDPCAAGLLKRNQIGGLVMARSVLGVVIMWNKQNKPAGVVIG